MVAEHGNPAAQTAGFHLFPAFETRYFLAAQLVDDRTDDCAFGAMMSLALRPIFGKLRFQMIADSAGTCPSAAHHRPRH
jgi:hypothetical protein